MLTIHTLHDHTRMSTQDLLLSIEKAVNKGETDFYVDASGQHDIGGPLWNKEGKKLTFTVTNPGQRVGCMALPLLRFHLHRRPRRHPFRIPHEEGSAVRGSGALDS